MEKINRTFKTDALLSFALGLIATMLSISGAIFTRDIPLWTQIGLWFVAIMFIFFGMRLVFLHTLVFGSEALERSLSREEHSSRQEFLEQSSLFDFNYPYSKLRLSTDFRSLYFSFFTLLATVLLSVGYFVNYFTTDPMYDRGWMFPLGFVWAGAAVVVLPVMLAFWIRCFSKKFRAFDLSNHLWVQDNEDANEANQIEDAVSTEGAASVALVEKDIFETKEN